VSVVHHPVQALARLGCCAAAVGALLLCGCGTTAPHAEDVSAAAAGVGNSIRSDDCTDWRRGSIAQRHTTIVELRNFAASAVGSSQGLKHGHVLAPTP
jgi:hypothetical protein